MVLREKHGPEIDTIISRYAQKRSAVLPILYIAQDEYGHLTDAAIREVAQLLELPPHDGKLSLRLLPRGDLQREERSVERIAELVGERREEAVALVDRA